MGTQKVLTLTIKTIHKHINTERETTMFYIIATIGDDNFRIYNTDTNEIKDLSYNLVVKLKQAGADIKNTTQLKDGKFRVVGGKRALPHFIKEGSEKKLATKNILTVIRYTDAGKTEVVDAYGKRSTRFTSSLLRADLSNATATFDGRLDGCFEKVEYGEDLDEINETLSLFGADLDDDQMLGEAGEWEYTGDKKASHIVVPTGVTCIKPNCFDGVVVGVLELPETLTELNRGALNGIRVTQVLQLQAFNLKQIGPQAFYNTRINELRIYGQPFITRMSFYGGRISKISAQGRTYSLCLEHKPSATTRVKQL